MSELDDLEQVARPTIGDAPRNIRKGMDTARKRAHMTALLRGSNRRKHVKITLAGQEPKQ